MAKPGLLITGCRGLIGNILWQDLGDDYELSGLDLASSGASTRIVQADITRPEQVLTAFQRMSPLSAVIHLAGDARMEADWDSVLTNNIHGTKNIYEAAHLSGVKRVIFASSNHVTGAYEGFPPDLYKADHPRQITTQDPICPDGFYGVSKAAGEALARLYYDRYGVESICLRIGSVIKGDDPRIDPRYSSTWLSHRDLVQLIRKSLTAKIGFGIYYGVSNNRRRFWDISTAGIELGYQPQDDASRLMA